MNNSFFTEHRFGCVPSGLPFQGFLLDLWPLDRPVWITKVPSWSVLFLRSAVGYCAPSAAPFLPPSLRLLARPATPSPPSVREAQGPWSGTRCRHSVGTRERGGKNGGTVKTSSSWTPAPRLCPLLCHVPWVEDMTLTDTKSVSKCLRSRNNAEPPTAPLRAVLIEVSGALCQTHWLWHLGENLKYHCPHSVDTGSRAA